jgi:hypothetical protein
MPFSRRLSAEPPLVQRRISSLIELLDEHQGETFVADELAGAVDLRPQQVAVALVALATIGRVSPTYDGARRRQVWSVGGADQRSSVPSPLGTQYTVAEAALATGRSEKALRGRIERRTLHVQRAGRFVFIAHAELQLRGLIDNRIKRTNTAHAARLIVERLRQLPRRGLSTWQLSNAAGLQRQTTELVLAALAAAGVVERRLAGGVVWQWIGT